MSLFGRLRVRPPLATWEAVPTGCLALPTTDSQSPDGKWYYFPFPSRRVSCAGGSRSRVRRFRRARHEGRRPKSDRPFRKPEYEMWRLTAQVRPIVCGQLRQHPAVAHSDDLLCGTMPQAARQVRVNLRELRTNRPRAIAQAYGARGP